MTTTPTTEDWLTKQLANSTSAGAIVLHAPSAAFQAPGGGEVQLVETGRALCELGHDVRPFVPWTDRLADARLLHLFGMSREGLALAQVAKGRGIPVVLSPICWFEPAAFRATAQNLPTAARAWASWLARRAAPWLPHWRRRLLQMADAILPNSQREARQLARLFAIAPSKFRVVPNGVNPRFGGASPEQFTACTGLSDFVLYVGRIEVRKNLHTLIQSLTRSGHTLVVIGSVVAGHEAYAARCRALGRSFVYWMDGLDHHNPLLASAYAAARVVALTSWFETPGLAALEGALAGCEVVITPLGCTREYFGAYAHYAHPANRAAIAAAVQRAYRQRSQPELANHVEKRYLWSHVAMQTARVYDDLVSH